MSSKHTPGPWAVEDPMGREVGLWIVQQGLETYDWACIAMVTADNDTAGRKITYTEQQANARLIAAAPDLLEALALLLEREEAGDVCELDRATARAAIAKAGGAS